MDTAHMFSAQAHEALLAQDFETAQTFFTKALRLEPTHVDALLGQAHVEWANTRMLSALNYTNRAYAAAPTHPTVFELYTALLAQLQYYTEALEWGLKGAALHPTNPALLKNVGLIYYVREDYPNALAFYRRVLALTPHDVAVEQMVASLGGTNPASLNPLFIKDHFNAYHDFTEKLVEKLDYRLPDQLATLLAPYLTPHTPCNVVDLGCGTGLAGEALRTIHRPATLLGIDLAETLLAEATGRGYTEVREASLADYFATAAPASAQLILCTDVLNYVGDVAYVVEGCRKVLSTHGLFAFSIEALPAHSPHDYFLMPTGRYAHAGAYVEKLAVQHGFIVLQQRDIIIRTDRSIPVNGSIYILKSIR
jgi:predicted TPR repeat methyltransferase